MLHFIQYNVFAGHTDFRTGAFAIPNRRTVIPGGRWGKFGEVSLGFAAALSALH